jgi:hypothetical protein
MFEQLLRRLVGEDPYLIRLDFKNMLALEKSNSSTVPGWVVDPHYLRKIQPSNASPYRHGSDRTKMSVAD